MATFPVANAFAGKWWILLIRGILAVLFGVIAFALPGLTLVTLVLLYGIYALADGVTALWVGGSARAWPLVLIGILGVTPSRKRSLVIRLLPRPMTREEVEMSDVRVAIFCNNIPEQLLQGIFIKGRQV